MTWYVALAAICSALILAGIVWCCIFVGSKSEQIDFDYDNDKKNKN